MRDKGLSGVGGRGQLGAGTIRIMRATAALRGSMGMLDKKNKTRLEHTSWGRSYYTWRGYTDAVESTSEERNCGRL